ncbi:hypothetical protein HC022_15340 [Salipiger sp. HF18]|uniref:hypothetical protein n=1 Tax=Salipiger sp. HF18 TaxID=2721557 RepID=UPI00142E6BAF|nr:hypothetical protein [Salipiger sp. HF18]NIY97566.1 hypothetical protein [Salipiger sp. HF18]
MDNGTCRFAVVTPGMSEEVISHSVPESVTMPTRDKTCRKAQGETWLASDTHDGAFRGLSRLPPVTDATSASARMKDGVLWTTSRRAEYALRGQRIAVGRGQAILDGDPRPVLPESGSCRP